MGILRRHAWVFGWLKNEGWPRLLAIWRRAISEDDHYQLLTHVTEAKTCILMADRPEGALVEDWSPAEYRQQAVLELQRAETILRRIGSYH